jgi:hypothetical protein
VTLQELRAFIGAALWAMLWWPVGRVFGWWAGAGASVGGGFVGLVLGWLLVEWINRLGPHRGWVRTAAVFAGLLVGFSAFVSLPLWVLSVVRVERGGRAEPGSGCQAALLETQCGSQGARFLRTP